MDTLDALRLLPAKVDALTAEVAALRARLDGMTPGGGFMPVRAAAEYAGVGRSKVYDLLSDGRLTRHRIDGRVLVARAELDALIRSTAPEAR